MSIFLAFEAPQGCWDIFFNPLEAVADLHFFGNIGLIICQDVGVGLYLLTTLSDCNSLMFVAPCFPGTAVISFVVAYVSSSLLITPLEEFSLSWGYALHLVVWKLFILKMFLACFKLFISTSKFLFRVFFTFL